jgi:hypothetical protein
MTSGPSVVDRLTVADVLRAAGRSAPTARGFFRCPVHGDENPSAHVVPNSGGRAWRCMVCGAKGGLLDLGIAVGLGNNRAAVARRLEERVSR